MGKVWGFLKGAGIAAADIVSGGRASEAVREVADLLGIEADSEDELLGALKARPDLVAQLKEQEAELTMRLHEIAAQDRQNARQREVQTGDVWTPRAIAAVIGVGFLATIVFMWVHANTGIDPTIETLFARTQGQLEGVLATIATYYFGSSSSEFMKDHKAKES